MDDSSAASPAADPWNAALSRGRADTTAGRVTEVDTEQLCREIEAEADALENRKAQEPASAA